MLLRFSKEEPIETDSKSIINISNSGNVRHDTYKSKVIDGESIFEKQSEFGILVSPSTAIFSDFFKVDIHKDSGEIIDYKSITQWPMGIAKNYFDFGNCEDEETKIVSNTISNLKDISNTYFNYGSLVENNSSIPYFADTFEDDFQISYIDSAGAILSLFSTLNQSIPYSMYILIDSKKGFNIQNLHISTIIDKQKFIAIMKNNMTIIANIVKNLSNVCTKENRHILAYVYIHPFGTNIRCKDVDFNNIEFVYNINLSDNVRILQTNQFHNMKEYSNSCLLNNLLKLGVPVVLDSLNSVLDKNYDNTED
jgi:hypothetical protein